ncbi:MAG: alpha-amylase family protein [Planctomycetota bacterium]|jgi:hypothetical protein
MKKELCVTNDYYDEAYRFERHLTEENIDQMMKYSASLGTKRFAWVLDTMWNFYEEDSPIGYDLLKTACDSAHKYGMRFDVVYKPFEGGLPHPYTVLPHTFPEVEGVHVLKERKGIIHGVRKFVVDNPHMRMSRRSGDGVDPGGKITEIRLIKNDESKIRFKMEDLSFWYSSYNGGFRKYRGDVECNVSREWRMYYPYRDTMSTVLDFTGFDFPEDAAFFMVKCERLSKRGNFSNHLESMVELINEKGQLVPCSPSVDKTDPDKLYERARKSALGKFTNYVKAPDVREIISDSEKFKKSCRGMHTFGLQWGIHTLDRDGEIAVCRGKPEYYYTILHPIYPEVRHHWLAEIQYCVDRGVDGVNIRIANHNRVNEPWAYGFNKPVLEKLKNTDDIYEASLINGQAFDTFMEEAAALLHKHRKEFGVHINAVMLRPNDRGARPGPVPRNFVWNWENWLTELVDYVEFRGSSFLKFHNLKETISRIGHVADRAGIPFIYQSTRDRSVMHFDGPHHHLAYEMKWALDHPFITCYNLYETANFCKFNEEGEYIGSPGIAELVRKYWI